MEQNNEYFVFISYSSLDNEWAIWLRHELEHYHLPASFNGRTDVRDNLRKVFRDRDELSAGPEWDEQVQKALEETNNLIVICSPHSAKSDAVNKEIETFIALGKEDHIFPFIVEGDNPEDCFPKALKHSKLAGDIIKDGSPNIAFIKIVAGMLNVEFSELWNRYEIEKAEEEQKIREQRDKLLIMQSRFLAEKANALVEEGDSYTARLLALEALPKDLENPDRPYVPEAEAALRKANYYNHVLFKGHQDLICTASFDSQGHYIVSASIDGTLKIWDIYSGVCVATHDGFASNVTSACFSKDGNKIITGDLDGKIQIWDVESWTCLIEINGFHHGICGEIQCHPDGKHILAPSDHNRLKIWNIEDGKTILTISGDTDSEYEHFYNAMFSHDGRFIAAIDDMQYPRLYDAESGELIRKYDIMSNYSTLSFNRSGTLLAIGSISDIYILVVESGEVHRVFRGHEGTIESVCFSPDDEFLLSSDCIEVRIWRIREGDSVRTIPKPVSSISYSNDGRSLLCYNDNRINIIDLTGRIQLYKSATDQSLSAIPLHEIHPQIYATINNKTKEIEIHRIENREIQCKLKGHKKAIDQIIISPNEKTLVSMSIDKSCNLWDVENGILLDTISTKYNHIHCPNPVAYSNNGRFVVAASNNTLKITDTLDGSNVMNILGNFMWISYVAFNICDTMVLSVSSFCINVWDIETGNCIKTIESPESVSFFKAYFSPDNTQIVTISSYGYEENVVSLWSIENGNLLYSLWDCFDACFSSDGEWLASTAKGGEICLLNTKSLEFRQIGKNHHGFLFSKDAKLLFFAQGYDVEIYNIKQREICMKLKHESNLFKLIGVTRDEHYLITQEGYTVCVWDITTGCRMYAFDISKTSFSDNGENIEFIDIEILFKTYTLYPIKDLIEKNKEQLSNSQLTPEERRKYYLD